MEKINLYGFNVVKELSGKYFIEGFCKYPQEKKKCLYLYNKLEEVNVELKGISFPNLIKHWSHIVEPTDDNIPTFYSLIGILKIIQINRWKIQGRETFIKPELKFYDDSEFPFLILNFYQFNEFGDIEVNSVQDVISLSKTTYVKNPFTRNLLSKLKKKNAKIEQLKHIPIIPLSFIEFDNEGITKVGYIYDIIENLI